MTAYGFGLDNLTATSDAVEFIVCRIVGYNRKPETDKSPANNARNTYENTS